MKRQHDPDLLRAFQQLTDTAEAFVNRAPRVKRIEVERSSLVDAITDAQLVLSVHQLPKDQEAKRESDTRAKKASSEKASLLKVEEQTSQANLAELERQLGPLRLELKLLQSKAHNAEVLLDTALATPKKKNAA